MWWGRVWILWRRELWSIWWPMAKIMNTSLNQSLFNPSVNVLGVCIQSGWESLWIFYWALQTKHSSLQLRHEFLQGPECVRQLYPWGENQDTHTGLDVCVAYVRRDWLIQPLQTAWDTWEQVNYGSHTLINPYRYAQLDVHNAVSGTLLQKDSGGKISNIISSGIICRLTALLEWAFWTAENEVCTWKRCRGGEGGGGFNREVLLNSWVLER